MGIKGKVAETAEKVRQALHSSSPQPMDIKGKVAETAEKVKHALHDEEPPPVDMMGTVGETAGKVWQVLNDDGPQTLAQLKKTIKEPAEVVAFAVGWLAREDKVGVVGVKKGFTVSLR